MANRLKKVIGGLISKDQMGFILTKTTYDNIRRLFLNMQALKKETNNGAIFNFGHNKSFRSS